MANKFLVSVADAILRDPTTLEALAVGKANMNSSIALTMQKTEVRGGINNPLLYTYFHDRNVEFTIEQVVFGKVLLALNLGTSVVNGTYTLVKTQDIVLSSGSGNLSETPTAGTSVTVFLPNGTSQLVTPSGSAIYVPTGANQKVTAVYTYSETLVDQVVATSTTPPDVVDLTLIAEVRDSTGTIVEYLQVNVPRYQVSGNYTLSLASNGVSTESLNGVALVNESSDASSDYYFKASWIPVSTTTLPVTAIAITPSVVTFSVAAGLPKTYQLTTLGIRGGIYSNVNITSSCSYTPISGCTTITCGSYTGLVTASSAAAASHTRTFQAIYYDSTTGSLTDLVTVNVAA